MSKGTPSRGKRQKTAHFVADAVVTTHITSKSLYVHHADLAQLHAFVSFLGARKPTVLRLDFISFEIVLQAQWLQARFSWSV